MTSLAASARGRRRAARDGSAPSTGHRACGAPLTSGRCRAPCRRRCRRPRRASTLTGPTNRRPSALPALSTALRAGRLDDPALRHQGDAVGERESIFTVVGHEQHRDVGGRRIATISSRSIRAASCRTLDQGSSSRTRSGLGAMRLARATRCSAARRRVRGWRLAEAVQPDECKHLGYALGAQVTGNAEPDVLLVGQMGDSA